MEELSIFNCGRKSFQLDARLSELAEVVQSLGLDSLSKYNGAHETANVEQRNEKEELRPYRELCAERLKLSGTGSWDPREFLSDLFYMPYVEPRINQFNIVPPDEVLPDLRSVKKDEVLRLCQVWDVKGLLRIFHADQGPHHRWGLCKVFNNFKNAQVDRQIGDRRGMNWCQGRIPGPSKSLPNATALLQLAPLRFSQMLSAAITDRRDFYHQFWMSDSKACGNAMFPVFKAAELAHLKAYDSFVERASEGLKKNRIRKVVGDFLHAPPKKVLFDDGVPVIATFGALFQGDHLAVEFATDSHANLMMSIDFLRDSCRLQGGKALFDDSSASGLIIDDFFIVSKEPAVDCKILDDSSAVRQLSFAKKLYAEHGILGSDDKDVLGDVLFKICGAEVCSTWPSVKRGVVAAGAPYEKRLMLALISGYVASLGHTSDAFHACLIGSWVSLLMMRRQAMACIDELFKVIPSTQLNVEKPRLWRLSAESKDELLVLAALAPILTSNLAVPFAQSVFATDASLAKGGITEAPISEELSAVLWRTADRSGGSVPMLGSARAILSCYDPNFEYSDEPYDQGAEWSNDGFLDPVNGGGVSSDLSGSVSRPLGLNFEFIELCGGAGVITKELLKSNVVCGPIIDLAISPHYDLANRRVIQWVIFMLEQDRLLSFHVSPPCTTFSPAAYPSVRSYKQPRGYDMTSQKVLIGNCLAFAALTLLLAALRLKRFGLGEQPRRSKMRWLPEWQRLLLLGATEVWLASCAYGSVHQKEFVFVAANMYVAPLHRRCSRDHEHVRIQGGFTKPSATYCHGLAVALAQCFRDHIDAWKKARDRLSIQGTGLEDVVTNDIALAANWVVSDAWTWKGKAHINVLETAAATKLLRRVARAGGDQRLVYLVDSHVSRSVVMKGRSSSKALKRLLRMIASICLAYGLYPAGRFCPTRLNPSDHPTRDSPLPAPCQSLFAGAEPEKLAWVLSSTAKLKRWTANWARLVLLVLPSVAGLLHDPSSSRRHASTVISNPEWWIDFDSTLGYPGEGPSWIFVWIFLFYCLPTRVFSVGGRGASHGDALRRQQRAGIVLDDGRKVTPTTSFHREGLLVKFRNWLVENGFSFDELVMSSPPDLDALNQKLVDYGRFLFAEGKPYYHYAETLNAVTSARPLVRRSLMQAWDLAFLWSAHEPGEHHIAVPYQILIALISTAWLWGWRREAAVFALAFGALLRIGEITNALRSDLVLPSDVDNTVDFVLLRIQEPKTRYRSARHQAGKLEQVDLIEIVRIGFQHLKPYEPLWPLSGSSLRLRLTRLLERLGLPTKDCASCRAISLASFRPGGATWLMTATESAELVRRRGRWASFRIMEIYLQEVSSITYMNDISDVSRQKILLAMKIFPDLLVQVKKFESSHIPESTWYFFFTRCI